MEIKQYFTNILQVVVHLVVCAIALFTSICFGDSVCSDYNCTPNHCYCVSNFVGIGCDDNINQINSPGTTGVVCSISNCEGCWVHVDPLFAEYYIPYSVLEVFCLPPTDPSVVVPDATLQSGTESFSCPAGFGVHVSFESTEVGTASFCSNCNFATAIVPSTTTISGVGVARSPLSNGAGKSRTSSFLLGGWALLLAMI